MKLAGTAPSEVDAALGRQIAEGMKAELKQRCLDRGTVLEVECARKVTTLAEFQACGTIRPG